MPSPIPSKPHLPHWRWLHLLGCSRQRNYYSTSMPQSGRRPQHQKQTLHRVSVMSALPPIADIAESDWHVRFVPKADIGTNVVCRYSITSSARNKSDVGMDIPRACAVRMLSTVSNFVGRSIGSVAGSAPRATLLARTPTSRYRLSRFGP
jgi:hypothetical protein